MCTISIERNVSSPFRIHVLSASRPAVKQDGTSLAVVVEGRVQNELSGILYIYFNMPDIIPDAFYALFVF